MAANKTILALDVGGRRIGVALARAVTQLASSLPTLEVSDNTIVQLHQLCKEHEVDVLVLGLPRNLQGDDTDQTRFVRDFAVRLQAAMPDIELEFQDEALTSRQAEDELRQRGKPYQKGDIDALAATYILEDYLRDHVRTAV